MKAAETTKPSTQMVNITEGQSAMGMGMAPHEAWPNCLVGNPGAGMGGSGGHAGVGGNGGQVRHIGGAHGASWRTAD